MFFEIVTPNCFLGGVLLLIIRVEKNKITKNSFQFLPGGVGEITKKRTKFDFDEYRILWTSADLS